MVNLQGLIRLFAMDSLFVDDYVPKDYSKTN